ncbi:ABC transporter permease [Eubacteriales bacterium OttesenSCG-928-N14]|nr:ABC transporter permease [Eubacteriales bacterium OttesenSCG-928-N14]
MDSTPMTNKELRQQKKQQKLDAKMEKRRIEAAKPRSYWGSVFFRLRSNRRAMISLFLLLTIVLGCILVPMLSPYDYISYDVPNRNQPPSLAHPLGTDSLGRDLMVRLFQGGRISLGISLAVTFIQCVLGVVLGCLAGFYGGIIDTIIMRISEIFMSFPFLIMCITIVSVFGSSSFALIFTLAILSWPSITRIVRGQILTLREQEYMEACEALGISDYRRIFRHLLPNVLAYVIVYATLGMASVILTETSLSFLGLGVAPPMPTWGNLIQEARNMTVIASRVWIWVPPGVMIFLSVMCFNLLGDGLRDAIDPKMKR